MINKKKVDSQLIQLLTNKQEVFIQVIDKYKNGSADKISQIVIDNNYNNGITINSAGTFYFSGIKKEHYEILLRFINTKTKLFSIYGRTNEIDNIKDLIKHKQNTVVDYFIMRLDKKQLTLKDKQSDDKQKEFRFCNENDFSLLKKLQYNYHIEEVYKNSSNYPYNYEMNAFKLMLKNRDNYALFINNIPVSKCYVNALSYDTAQLGGIFTEKEHRNKGYSYECINNFIDKLFQKRGQIKKIQLFVKKENIPAVRLYQKLGFEIVAETTSVYYTIV